MTRRLMLLLVLGLAVASAAGCGEKEEPGAGSPGDADELRLVLDYFPNADHAGLYAAQAAGDYKRAGLDVRIQAPPDPLSLIHI